MRLMRSSAVVAMAVMVLCFGTSVALTQGSDKSDKSGKSGKSAKSQKSQKGGAPILSDESGAEVANLYAFMDPGFQDSGLVDNVI